MPLFYDVTEHQVDHVPDQKHEMRIAEEIKIQNPKDS
jgi:hypothetical protein